MARLLLALMLLSCSAPTSVTATPPSEPSASRSIATPTAPVPSAPPLDPASLPRCPASQLQAVAAGAMSTDSFVGAVFFANRGTAPCTLRGNGELVLLASDGSPLELRLASVSAAAPKLVVVPVSEFQQGPTGLVGFGATAPLQWSNYCDDVLAARFRFTVPDGGGTIDGTFVDLAGRPARALGAPRCDDASGPSTLVMYPFQEPVR